MTTIPEATFSDLLRTFLLADRAASDVEAYFAESEPRYVGRNFERIAGGGDRPDRAHRITSEDLFAIQTLSVTVPPETGVQLLEGQLGLSVNQYLRDIPTTVSLLDTDAGDHLAGGAPAEQCWQLLVSPKSPGIGRTIAGKLLARKRPHLIPVYDDVVRCALGHPANFWLSLHHCLSASPHLREALRALRSQAPQHVSTIRVLDVVVWMAHEREHRTEGKPPAAKEHLSP